MRALLAPCLPLTLLLAWPVAAAQAPPEVVVTLTGEHPSDHVMEVSPESLRARMDFLVAIEARGFACPADAVVSIEGVLTYPAKDEWAGASLNPKATTVRIPAGQPIAGTERFEAKEPLTLEMAWGENHPTMDARVTYDIQTSTSLDGCAPAPAIDEEHTQVNATMPDMTPTTDPDAPCGSGEECACLDVGDCSVVEPNPTPSLSLALILASLFAAVPRRR